MIGRVDFHLLHCCALGRLWRQRRQRPAVGQLRHLVCCAGARTPHLQVRTRLARAVVIIGPIISKQRNLGLLTVLRHHMMKAPKSKWRDLSSRMSSRDPVIRIFDFRPPSVSRALPRWPIGSGSRHFGQFRWFNGSGEENLAKVSGGICPPGCPLEIQ